ncbi:MAG: hypothetical protein ACXVAG_13855 [Vulcanimicrobiaceae bacterium]
MRTTPLIATIALLLTLVVSVALPARSDTKGTWSGTVAYINNTHIGVRGSSQVKDFLLPADFDNVFSSNGQKSTRSDVHVGMAVNVTYLQSPLFGSARVTRIDLGLFAPLPLVTGTLPPGSSAERSPEPSPT